MVWTITTLKQNDITTSTSKALKASFVPSISIDLVSTRPIHRQLFEWYQAAIVDGRLRPGQRVPSTRSLAADLNVSRSPVLAAFEQLIAEGYLEASMGAGTRVSKTIAEHSFSLNDVHVEPNVLRSGPRLISGIATTQLAVGNKPWLEHTGAFQVSAPALDRFPSKLWRGLVSRHSQKTTSAMMAYGDPMGHLPLREAIAQYLGTTRAVRCTAAQIMIVSGSQHGLHIASRSLLNSGDEIWMEEPGYPGAHAAFSMAGACVAPIPVDEQGLDVEHGICANPNARLAYVTPSHQYPMGIGMSAARRIQLLNWARSQNAWIIEDDYDSEYRFGVYPTTSLQGLDTSGRVLYLGTFSKVMFPALRIGYIVIPENLIATFCAVRGAIDIFPPTLMQAALADFIAEGHFSRHLRKTRTLYMARRQTLVEEIHKHLGNMVQIVGIEAGMHLTCLLSSDADDSDIAERASHVGLSIIPLSSCCLARPASKGIVLGYGNVEQAEIIRGVELLTEVIRQTAS